MTTALPGLIVTVPMNSSPSYIRSKVREALYRTGFHMLAERFCIDAALAHDDETAWIAASYVVFTERPRKGLAA